MRKPAFFVKVAAGHEAWGRDADDRGLRSGGRGGRPWSWKTGYRAEAFEMLCSMLMGGVGVF